MKLSMVTNFQRRIQEFKQLNAQDKRRAVGTFLLNNSLYIFMVLACIYIQIKNPIFLSLGSLNNIIQLSAANIPIALGIAGAIILTGTDLSAGRIVGLTAVISAALLQAADYGSKMFGFAPISILLVFPIVLFVGACVGFVNGYSVSKFSLHPFIVTLATQLIVYGCILIFLTLSGNQGQPLSGLSDGYKELVKGSILSPLSPGQLTPESGFFFKLWYLVTGLPNFVWLALLITLVMWIIWNKTRFGKNMFAVGSNPEAAKVSGVNVHRTIMMVFILAGMTYAYTGFIESARIGSNSASTGFNYELDAISACVIGGVSFVGGTGKISGVIAGVVLLRLIFVGLTVLAIDQNLQFIIKGAIILLACAIDMRKYLTKK